MGENLCRILNHQATLESKGEGKQFNIHFMPKEKAYIVVDLVN